MDKENGIGESCLGGVEGGDSFFCLFKRGQLVFGVSEQLVERLHEHGMGSHEVSVKIDQA